MTRLLVTVDEAAQSGGVRLFDCRHSLTEPDRGLSDYLAGHIPGALHAHTDRNLSSISNGTNGRHPLPERDVLVSWLGHVGVTGREAIVVYDDVGGAFAARLWWLLRWVGHSNVAMLDGGWQAWLDAGLPIETERPYYAPDRFEAGASLAAIVDADDLLNNITQKQFVVVDARAKPRFLGQEETVDPVAGHIPGAVNRPFSQNLTDQGFFRPPSALREEFLALANEQSPEQIVHQCGSGVTACHNLFAMELAGLVGSRLYPGSWSEWCSDHNRPIATSESENRNK